MYPFLPSFRTTYINIDKDIMVKPTNHHVILLNLKGKKNF